MNLKIPTLLPLVNSEEELVEQLKRLRKWQPRGGMAVVVDGQPCVKIPVGCHGNFALIDLADYPLVGQFYWRETARKANWAQYAVRGVGENNKRQDYLMHCQLLEFPEMEIDHINHNGLDNRRCNLRLATRRQNMMNNRPRKKFKGIYLSRNKLNPWCAQLHFHGRHINLGYHPTEEIAARAYDEAAKQFFGEFACLNFPMGACKQPFPSTP